MKKLKPALVLSAITAVIGALLIVCTNLVPDTSGTISGKLLKKCVELMGEGEFSIVEIADKPDEIKKVIKKDDGSFAFEVSVKGYKSGFNLLVAVNGDGSARGIAAISSSETYAKKLESKKYYEKFSGVSEAEIGGVEAISGATKSSNGVKKAVEIAVVFYKKTGVENG